MNKSKTAKKAFSAAEKHFKMTYPYRCQIGTKCHQVHQERMAMENLRQERTAEVTAVHRSKMNPSYVPDDILCQSDNDMDTSS